MYDHLKQKLVEISEYIETDHVCLSKLIDDLVAIKDRYEEEIYIKEEDHWGDGKRVYFFRIVDKTAKELEDEKKEVERHRKTGLEQLKRQAEANGYILTKKGD